MLIQEIHERFLHFYDKQSNYSAPEITAEEIDIYLNREQEDLIDSIASRGFEKTGEYSDYLKNLIIPYDTNTFTTGTKPNSYLVQIPTNYRSALLEELTLNYTDCNGTTVSSRIPVVPVTRDEYNKLSYDPFNKPWKEEVKRISQGNNFFEIICSAELTPVRYYLDYIKIPNKMAYATTYATAGTHVECELDEKAQNIIIDKAVLRALKTLGDSRIQLENLEYQSQINKIK